MPAYDYDCAACGRRFEVIHGVHAEQPGACPLCGGGPVRKAITAAAIHYKGSGWAKKERRATASSASSRSEGEGTPTSEEGTKPEDGTKPGRGSRSDGSAKTDPAKPAPAKAAEAGAASNSD